jgi:short-subunit dehydrogenase
MKNKKVILITGASSGMGHETAEDLITLGHTVYCAARSTKKMEDLKKIGGKILEMDVSKPSSLKKRVDKIIKQEGKIDVLWNNAGYGLFGPVEEVPIKDARYQFEVNLFGLAELTQLVLPHMRKQNSGTIINTSSMGGKIYTPLGAWYHATKHAVEGFSDCLRLELKEFNIDVVVLEPGIIETSFSNVLMRNFPDKARKGPYKRIVKALESTAAGGIKGSPPSLISNTIQRIINSEKPKIRYLVGKMAKFLVYTRKLLGDRLYDRIIMSRVKE